MFECDRSRVADTRRAVRDSSDRGVEPLLTSSADRRLEPWIRSLRVRSAEPTVSSLAQHSGDTFLHTWVENGVSKIEAHAALRASDLGFDTQFLEVTDNTSATRRVETGEFRSRDVSAPKRVQVTTCDERDPSSRRRTDA